MPCFERKFPHKFPFISTIGFTGALLYNHNYESKLNMRGVTENKKEQGKISSYQE
jgi:hypothetical protein